MKLLGKKSKKKKPRGIRAGLRDWRGRSAFEKVIALGIAMIALGFTLWSFQSTITSVKFFSIVMTLGGLESYNDTVTAILILMLIFGVWLIAEEE